MSKPINYAEPLRGFEQQPDAAVLTKKRPVQVGECFGRLKVVRYLGTERGARRFECLCDCGKLTSVEGPSLRAGNTKSCGCLKIEMSTKHGYRNAPEYPAWKGMIRRCMNPLSKQYVDYGGRGITVCSRWVESLANFLEDVGPRPSPRHSIGRIDNDGNYEPGNVKWSTPKEQQNNTRANVIFVIDGEELTLSEASSRYGISKTTVRRRMNHGWPMSEWFIPGLSVQESGRRSAIARKQMRKESPMSERINYTEALRGFEQMPDAAVGEINALRFTLRRVIEQRDYWQLRYAEVAQQLDEERRKAAGG